MAEEKAKGEVSNFGFDKNFQIQHEIRNNADEFRNAILELNNWEKEIKEREKQRNNHNPNESVEMIRTHKLPTNQQNPKQKEAANIKPSVPKMEMKKEIASNSVDYSTLKKEADTLKDKGNYHVKLSEFEKAISFYTEAINKEKNDPVYYANRALCYLKLERYNECIKDCNRAIQLNSKYSKAFYRRMQAYESLGDNEKAFRDCKNVLDIEPKNSEAKSCFVRLKKKLANKAEFNEAFNLKSYSSSVFKSLPNNVIEIETITKPPHLRSTVPLKRIQISEMIETSSKDVMEKTNKNAENLTIASNHVNQLGDMSENITTKSENMSANISKSDDQPAQISRKESSNDVEIVSKDDTRKKTIVNLNPPKTTFEFYAKWRELSKEQKYLYLKGIEPSNINRILGIGLNSEILTDIISTLSEYFVNNDENIEKILFNISNHSQLSILSYFLSEGDKKGLLKIIDHMQKQNNSEHIRKIQNAFLV